MDRIIDRKILLICRKKCKNTLIMALYVKWSLEL